MNEDALATAIRHLADFRVTWNEGDEISEECHLTADDLDMILARLAETKGAPAMQQVELEG